MIMLSSLGFLLLAIYLILIGITGLVPTVKIPAIVMSVLALIAGICLLLGRFV